MDSKDPRDRIWVPLDVPNFAGALSLLSDLVQAGVRNFKVGLELITMIGSRDAVSLVRNYTNGLKVWYDGKFCDIPNTVAGASKATVSHGVDMFNVHASCGMDAMRAAAQNKGNAKLLAVTVLTSLTAGSLYDIGYPSCWPGVEAYECYGDRNLDDAYVKPLVRRMAMCAMIAGCDGVVCSPQELEVLARDSQFTGMKITPGVRPAWAEANDQKRVMTPAEAIKAGATELVIGRPIIKPPKEIGTPADAFKRICDEIAGVL